MLRFQWNALRPGDRVLVHDDLAVGLDLNEGLVKLVETRSSRTNDVGIRLNATGKMLRPRHHAVHMLPLDRRISCWRCDTIAALASPTQPQALAA